MHDVHPGTTLGRYTLMRRVGDGPASERWLARDTDLERDVVLHLLPGDGPHTEAALDAARRASGITHPGLTRILDVDRDDRLAWVTEAWRSDDETLDDLARQGLPAEEVRRLTGEVALVLDAARTRGMHHLALTPGSVLVGHDGSVRVRGLGVDGALAGADEDDPRADSVDAASVVALAYAGLTGTWPLPGGSTLPPAPRDATGVLPPSKVAAGVPTDLDTICRETLADGAGPASPRDYASSITPWSSTRVIAHPVDDEEPETVEMPVRQERSTGALPAASAGPTAPVAPTGAVSPVSTDPTAAPDAQGTTTQTTESTGAGTDPTTASTSGPTTSEAVPSPEGTDGRPGAGRTAAATAASVAGALAGGGKVLGERLGRAAQSARERAEVAAADRRAQREAIRTSEAQDRVALGGAGTREEIEPPAPLLPAESGESPSPEQSRLVLAIMAGLVTVALVLGCLGTSRIGDNTDLGRIFGSDTQQTAVPTTDPSSTSTSDSGGGGAAEPIQVLSAIGYDPNGDQAEHNSEAQRVYDNDLTTSWTTEGYVSPNFGNKGGVGLVLDLGQSQDVSSAQLQLPTPVTVQVFVGDEPGITGVELGKSEGESGAVTISRRTPATGQYVTVWFTTTAPGDDGTHRAELAEVVLR